MRLICLPSSCSGGVQSHPLALPAGNQLSLHLASFDANDFDASAFEVEGIEFPSEIARSVPKRQAEFFYGRLAARAALRAHGSVERLVPIGDSREPIWPAGFVGSISHTVGLAGAVVGSEDVHVGLGIDIERTVCGESQLALRKIALDADELERLSGLEGLLSLDELVTLVFSAKESLYKAAYGTVGRFFDFDAARVFGIDASRGVIELSIAEDLHPAFARGRVCHVTFVRLDDATFVTAFEARQSRVQT